MAQRKIIHVDCDCFYAAVEMRDDPNPAFSEGTNDHAVLQESGFDFRSTRRVLSNVEDDDIGVRRQYSGPARQLHNSSCDTSRQRVILGKSVDIVVERIKAHCGEHT